MEDTNSKSDQLSAVLVAAGEDPIALKKIATAAIAVVAEHEKTITEAVDINADLQKQVEAYAKGEKFLPSVEIDGEKYDAVHAVNFKGKVYQPKDIVEDIEVATALVKGSSSALVKQPAKEVTE